MKLLSKNCLPTSEIVKFYEETVSCVSALFTKYNFNRLRVKCSTAVTENQHFETVKMENSVNLNICFSLSIYKFSDISVFIIGIFCQTPQFVFAGFKSDIYFYFYLFIPIYITNIQT